MTQTTRALALIAGCVAGCYDPPGGTAARVAAAVGDPELVCEVLEAGRPLPDAARESSGLARSSRDGDLFWTHNDAGNEPELIGVGPDGALVARVPVAGARLEDWEDIEAAPCPAGACLLIGDIGDNDAERHHVTVYRVPEPAPDAGSTDPAEAFHAVYPDGPRDAEALFAGPDGDLFVVGKGRDEEIALYRWRLPRAPSQVVTLERVRTLFPRPDDDDDRVTGASATPDGRWVGIRTYRTLYVYPLGQLVAGEPVQPGVFDLSALGEPQGEAMALSDDGDVWLSSEAAGNTGPQWARLRCSFPGGQARAGLSPGYPTVPAGRVPPREVAT